jgi:plastocyanin
MKHIMKNSLWQWSFLIILMTMHPVALATAADVTGKVVDDQGNGIPQAVVFVQNPPQSPLPKTPRKATLDQVDKQFVPRLLPIAIGTEVQFPNHDQIHHHVYSFSRLKSFDLPLYKGEATPAVTFDQPGVITVGCNIHDWMSATIVITPSQHFAVTDANGRFSLPDLPSGSYSLVAWHERSRGKLADTAQPVQSEGQPPELTFTLTLKPAPAARPANSGQRGYQ